MTRLLRNLRVGADLMGNLFFLVMFGAFLLQVFTRYVLNDPLGWTEEVSLIAYLWVVFWGAGLMVREDEHVRFDMIFQSVPIRARRILAVICAAGLAGMFLVGLPGNVDYVNFMAEDKTWILGIRFDIVFSVFIVFMVAYAARNLIRLWRLCRRDWSKEL